MPWPHAITIIVLKFVVIVMIAFAEGKKSNQPGIPCRALGRIRLSPENMAGTVDQERAMLQNDHPSHPGQQERAERAAPAVPKSACRRRKNETDDGRNQVDVAMLPANQPVFPQIRDIVIGEVAFEFEEQPANVSIKEALRDTVGIFVVIDMFMMTSVLACPHQG